LEIMLSLSNQQLTTVIAAARTLPVEKRGQYLQRMAAMLELRGRFSEIRCVGGCYVGVGGSGPPEDGRVQLWPGGV
jgi:hypothetical protein